jgi:hypothetical protein
MALRPGVRECVGRAYREATSHLRARDRDRYGRLVVTIGGWIAEVGSVLAAVVLSGHGSCSLTVWHSWKEGHRRNR